MRVELVSLVCLVDDGEGDSEPQPLEVAHLFGEGDGLRGKVHLELEDGACAGALAGDVEYPPLHYLLPRLHLQETAYHVTSSLDHL